MAHINHVTAELLRVKIPTAGCCDCTEEVDTVDDREVWTVYQDSGGTRFHYPACARNECIGPDD